MFRPNVIISVDKTLISVRQIESINVFRDSCNEIIDKLKDDLKITVNTVSGKTYEISMIDQYETFKDQYNIPISPLEIRKDLLVHWVDLISERQK